MPSQLVFQLLLLIQQYLPPAWQQLLLVDHSSVLRARRAVLSRVRQLCRSSLLVPEEPQLAFQLLLLVLLLPPLTVFQLLLLLLLLMLLLLMLLVLLMMMQQYLPPAWQQLLLVDHSSVLRARRSVLSRVRQLCRSSLLAPEEPQLAFQLVLVLVLVLLVLLLLVPPTPTRLLPVLLLLMQQYLPPA
jgi:transposase-like protein